MPTSMPLSMTPTRRRAVGHAVPPESILVGRCHLPAGISVLGDCLGRNREDQLAGWSTSAATARTDRLPGWSYPAIPDGYRRSEQTACQGYYPRQAGLGCCQEGDRKDERGVRRPHQRIAGFPGHRPATSLQPRLLSRRNWASRKGWGCSNAPRSRLEALNPSPHPANTEPPGGGDAGKRWCHKRHKNLGMAPGVSASSGNPGIPKRTFN